MGCGCSKKDPIAESKVKPDFPAPVNKQTEKIKAQQAALDEVNAYAIKEEEEKDEEIRNKDYNTRFSPSQTTVQRYTEIAKLKDTLVEKRLFLSPEQED